MGASAGGVVSILAVSLTWAVLPALSDTEHATLWIPSRETPRVQVPAVVAERLAGLPSTVQVGGPANPSLLSLAVIVSVTGEDTFQPF
jgi:hypothetical protein